jgi:hypothetical protein
MKGSLTRATPIREAVEVQRIPISLPAEMTGIVRYGDLDYLPEVAGSLRLWPHRLHIQLVLCLPAQKNIELDLPNTNPPSRPLERTDSRL